jgi:chloramphenicol-sensitive protein RarD
MRPVAASPLRRPAPFAPRRRGADPLVQTGILQAALAYVCWGLFPIYFKALDAVPPAEMLAHRVAWSLLFVGAVLLWQRRFAWLGPALRDRQVLKCFAASASVIALNWFVYIWAVVNHRVVDASLGYFINPLVNVLVGALLLHERLRAAQWAAVTLAALGVAWLTWQAGALPWIAFVLACSFASYGLLRKTAPLGALEGLAMETLILGPIALAVLLWLVTHDASVFAQSGPGTQALIAAAGPLTAIPLLLFAAGARRIPFSLLGLLQYIGPTLQLIAGVWLLGESFPPVRAVGFALIWAALALYSAESWWRTRRAAAAV